MLLLCSENMPGQCCCCTREVSRNLVAHCVALVALKMDRTATMPIVVKFQSRCHAATPVYAISRRSRSLAIIDPTCAIPSRPSHLRDSSFLLN